MARAGHVIAVACKRVRKEEKTMPKMHFRCTAAHRHTTQHTKQNNSSWHIARSGGGGPNQTRHKKPKSKSNTST